MSIFDHVSINVADFDASVAFYEKALAPLGISVLMRMTKEMTNGEFEGVGMGKSQADFWLSPGADKTATAKSGHIAFVTQNRAEVDAFYHAAIAAGGKDNGPPGPRPVYHPDYYGAFVYDLDGHHLEAVTHRPE